MFVSGRGYPGAQPTTVLEGGLSRPYHGDVAKSLDDHEYAEYAEYAQYGAFEYAEYAKKYAECMR